MPTEIFPVDISSEDSVAQGAERAQAALRLGGLVVAPTETTYGLLARADDPAALERLLNAKRRPEGMATAIFAKGRKDLFLLGKSTKSAEILVDNLLPGPLTLVLSNRSQLSAPVVVKSRIGLRWSSHKLIDGIVSRADWPVTATSANVSGEAGENDPGQIARALGSSVVLIIDAGRLENKASTVIDASGPEPVILREGAIGKERIEKILGQKL